MARTPQPVPASRTDILGRIFPWLFPVLLFFSITGTSRFAAVVLAVVAILFSIGRVPVANLRNRLSPLTAAVFFYSLVCLASGLCAIWPLCCPGKCQNPGSIFDFHFGFDPCEAGASARSFENTGRRAGRHCPFVY